MGDLSLDDYFEKKSKELDKLRKEIGLLRMINFPVRLVDYFGRVGLFSEDYSLATDFKIERRSTNLGSSTGYDGGWHIDRYDTYPQFYFPLKYKDLVKPVYIKHEGFDKDSRVVIKSVTETRGSGIYSSENGSNPHYVDLEKVFSFFRERGVKEVLLDRLAKRIKMAEEF